MTHVFGAVETPEAHTVDTDGLLLYAELRIGDSVVMIADTKPGWPFIGACCRYTVPDVERTLATLVGVSAR